ncbi:hypothetical protein NECAME_10493 [Necator americanus]|uniref:Uncharacterized protein n=1 Tax=Necator americanus TaxID=51031 RepID=W2T865_NECAM|nr:hypothetical protein NECAME_10493 [Necator americanus]ETN78210.1 hypothetical protein NECAME_10493 [Necator americanus]
MQQPFTFSQICYDPNKTNLLNARTRVLNHAPDYSSSTSKNLTSQLITTGADSCYHGLKLDEVHRKQHIMGKTKSTHGNQTDSSLVANYLTMFNSQPQCAGVPVTSAVNGVPSSQMLAVRPLPRQRKVSCILRLRLQKDFCIDTEAASSPWFDFDNVVQQGAATK